MNPSPESKLPQSHPLTHIDDQGRVTMVDVGAKPTLSRRAVAAGELYAAPSTLELLKTGSLPKGEVLATARLAGIMAAKRTAEWIPLCHSLPLDSVTVELVVHDDHVAITASAATRASTGVEMEAMVAVSAAGLTLYDMMKAVDKSMVLQNVRLLEKTKQ